MVQEIIKDEIGRALIYPNGLSHIEKRKPRYVEALSKEGYDNIQANEIIDNIAYKIVARNFYEAYLFKRDKINQIRFNNELDRHITARANYVRPVVNDLSLETVWR